MINDRSRWFASSENATLEMSIHRATALDDGADLGENLIDSSTISTKFLLVFDDYSKASMQQRTLEHQLNNQPFLFFADNFQGNFQDWNNSYYLNRR